MEKQVLHIASPAHVTAEQVAQLRARKINIETRGRMRGHLLSCTTCQETFANLLQELRPPEIVIAPRPMPQPPTAVLEAFGVQQHQKGVSWSWLQKRAESGIASAQEKLEQLRESLRSLLVPLVFPKSAVTVRKNAVTVRAAAGAAPRNDDHWREYLEVKAVDAAGQSLAEVQCQVVEPPTFRPTGEMRCIVRTQDARVAGGQLHCTITVAPDVFIDLTGELLPEKDNWGWQARLEERGFLTDGTEEPTVPFGRVQWSITGALGTEATSSLALRLWLQRVDPPAVTTAQQNGDTFRIGEHVRIGYSVNRDAYIYLFDIGTSGTITLFVPSPVWREHQVLGKERYFLPPERENSSLPVEGTPGTETLLAIASEQPLSIPPVWQSPGGPISQAALDTFLASLSQLPGRSVVERYQFEVTE